MTKFPVLGVVLKLFAKQNLFCVKASKSKTPKLMHVWFFTDGKRFSELTDPDPDLIEPAASRIQFFGSVAALR